MSQHNTKKHIAYMAQAINNLSTKAKLCSPAAVIRHPVPGIRYRGASNQYPALSIQHPVSSIQNPASSRQRPAARNQNPAASSQKGFTLLEVLIAMAIMAIVLVSVYRMHSQTLTMTTANRFYTQAPLLAQSKMAQLEVTSSESISGDSGDFGDNFPGYSWNVSTEVVSIEALGEAAADLNRIDLTVTLNENEYEYSIRSYRLMTE